MSPDIRETKLARVQHVDDDTWTVWLDTVRLITLPSKGAADDVADRINSAVLALLPSADLSQSDRDESPARLWLASDEAQRTDCVINGFYHVYPADKLDPPAAYVFGKDNARRIALALSTPEPVSAALVGGLGEDRGVSTETERGRGTLPPPSPTPSPDDEFFTVVFRGDIRALKFNPMRAETIFGPVVASGIGHAFEEIEAMHDDLPAGGR